MKSTETLQRDVVDELAWDPAVDSSAIGVTVADGVVSLEGQVRTYAEKVAAVKAARRIAGVKGVLDGLEVSLALSWKEHDAALAQGAIETLKWNVGVPQDAVKVTVQDGWVTLEGSVAWFYQRKAAETSIQHLKGVKGVTNLIAVKQRPSQPDIQAKIETAFKRNAEIDADRINVVTSDGRVTLRGRVRSWAERESAEDAVWAAPGVTEVSNEIVVEGVQ